MSAYPKTWDNDVVEEYIKQESQQKSPNVFLETHIPIQKIRAFQLTGGAKRPTTDDEKADLQSDYGFRYVDDFVTPGSGNDFIHEEQLFEHITRSSPDYTENRIYMLKGEVGSGKSHLCQWLEYQINDQGYLSGAEEHVAIHISRNNTRLNDILDKLYEHVEIDHDELDDIAQIDPKELADFITQALQTFGADTDQFPEFDLEAFISEDNSPNLKSILEDNLRDYRESVDDEDREQRIDLISAEEFRDVCFSAFGKTVGDAYPIIKNEIHERLITNVGIEDFQSELVTLAEQYQSEGKRPVLIAEDITTFTVLKEGLLDYIFQLGDGTDEMSSGYDVILGYTTGWETEQADDALMTGEFSFMTDRATGYLSLTNEEGEAYFLENGPVPIQLAQKYLSVIKEQSDTTDDRVDEEVFGGLYPFTEEFIMRAYRNLQEDGNPRQTPRLLLYHVMADSLLADIPPFERVEDNTYIGHFTSPAPAGQFETTIDHIVKWYGRMDGESIVVPTSYFETFGVDVPDHASVMDDEVHIETLYGTSDDWIVTESLESIDEQPQKQIDVQDTDSTEESTVEEGTPDEGKSPEGEDIEPDTSQQSPEPDQPKANPETAKTISQFKNWYGTGSEFPSAERLRDGVQAITNQFHDPTRLANNNATTDSNAAGFYYTLGNDVPVDISGADTGKDVSITVSPFGDGEVDHERMLYHLVLYTLETDSKDENEFPDELNHDVVRSWCDRQVFELRSEMRSELESALNNKMTLEQFVVFCHYLYLNAARGITELNKGMLLRNPDEDSAVVAESSPFKMRESDERDSDLTEMPPGLSEALHDLSVRRSDLASLCRGFFLLKNNFVDNERLEPALEYVEENFDECLKAATQIRVDEIPDAYRIGTSRSNAKVRVSLLFETVSDYANELRKFEQSFDPTLLSEEIETVQTLYTRRHTADELLDMYNRLTDSIEPLDTNLKERWEKAERILNKNPDELELGEFGDTLETIGTANPESAENILSVLHTYLQSKETQPAWTVYEMLAEMLEEIEDAPEPEKDEFRSLVCDSDSFNEFRIRRESTIKSIEGI